MAGTMLTSSPNFTGVSDSLRKRTIFVVQEDIHESPDLILIVADALFQTGIGALQTLNQLANRPALSVDDFLVSG